MSAKEKQVVEIQGKLEDITECPICTETYKEPKILPCIHTFCMKCLQETGLKINKSPGDKMPCPVCRTEFTVPEKGFVGLQRNFFMERLIEMKDILNPSSESVLCDACQEDSDLGAEVEIPSAAMYCADCNQRLCGECCKNHKKCKATKNHRMLHLDGAQINIPSIIVKPYVCDKHENKLLEIYCSSCQEVVCALCFYKSHKTHETSPVIEVITDFRKIVQENADTMMIFSRHLKEKTTRKNSDKEMFVEKMAAVESEIKRVRQNLQECTETDCDSLLQQLCLIKQERIKDNEGQLCDIEIVLASLVSYQAYCSKITEIGSDIDICRAVHNLKIRAAELKQLYESVSLESFPNIWLKKAEFYDAFFQSGNNIIGKIQEHEAQTSDHIKDDYMEISSDAEFCNLRCENLDTETLVAKTPQYDVNKSTIVKENEENDEENEEFLDCVEWNDDVGLCVASGSIELECLSELELMLTSKVKEKACTTESSLHRKLNELRQNMTNLLETIKLLKAELGGERVLRKEVEQERNMLVDRTKGHESDELRLHKMVEDLKRQNDLLTDLVTGAKEHSTRIKANTTCDAGVEFYKTLQNVSGPNSDSYRICGIAVLAKELYVLGNDGIVIIYGLSTLQFKRRWKMTSQDAVRVEDLRQCDTNKCLYIMKVGSTGTNEIQCVDPYGKVIKSWSVGKASGKLSVTLESNVLLTVTNQNRLLEFTPDGKLVRTVKLSWDYGIENPSHAIKLTSEQFLICHSNNGGALSRVCIVGKAGNVLKYFGEPCKKELLQNPIYLDFDGGGNILVVDYSNQRVLLLTSNLELKLDLGVRKSRLPRKVCFDKSNGRVLLLEDVYEYDLSHTTWIRKGDEVSIFAVNNPQKTR